MLGKNLDFFSKERESLSSEDDSISRGVTALKENVACIDIVKRMNEGGSFQIDPPADHKDVQPLKAIKRRLALIPSASSNVSSEPVHRRLWLALNFPLLALTPNCVVANNSIVVIETEGNVQRVWAANACAQKAGIRRGMNLNSAYALVGNLETVARNLGKERQVLEWLAGWALQFTPSVSIQVPDEILLEVKGSLRLFGGARALRNGIIEKLKSIDIVATTALAPTAYAASWLARSLGPYPNVRNFAEIPKHLAKLPLHCLRWPDAACEILQDLGVRTIGECLRLPRDGFARRVGDRFLMELDQAIGRVSQPLHLFKPRELYRGKRDFEMEVESISILESLLEPLLDELANFLRIRSAGIQAFRLSLHHRELAATRLVIRFVTPVSHKSHLENILRERLSRLVLPAPVIAARLQSAPLMTLDANHLNEKLFRGETQHDTNAIPRLIEKLRARLGDEAVYGLQKTEDYRPERAYKAVSNPFNLSDKRNDHISRRGHVVASSIVNDPASTQPRPLWLLATPEPLVEENGCPQLEGPLTLQSGPELIESGWWDDTDIKRDYYVARNRKGVHLWIYVERSKLRCWFLHGRFG